MKGKGSNKESSWDAGRIFILSAYENHEKIKEIFKKINDSFEMKFRLGRQIKLKMTDQLRHSSELSWFKFYDVHEKCC